MKLGEIIEKYGERLEGDRMIFYIQESDRRELVGMEGARRIYFIFWRATEGSS